MRKNHSIIVCIKLVHLPYFQIVFGTYAAPNPRVHGIPSLALTQPGLDAFEE